MVTVERKVCDVDGQEEGVREFGITQAGITRHIDLCKQCATSLWGPLWNRGRSEDGQTKSPRRFAKTPLPPQ